MNGLILGAFYTALYLYDGAGNLLWKIDLADLPISTFDWFFSPEAGVLDASGHVSVVGYYRQYNTLNSEIPTFRRYNRHGILKLDFEIQVDGVSASSLAVNPVLIVDGSQNSYVLLSKTTTSYQAILQKYNSAGVLQWQVILVSSVFNAGGGTVALDNAGDLIVTYASSFSGYLSKRDASDGSEIWTVAHPVGANHLAIDASDNIYACLANGVFEKYNSSGSLLADATATIDGSNNTGLILLYGGAVYVSGRQGCNEFDTNLVQQATYTTKPGAIDSDGNFYFIDSHHTGSSTDPLFWARDGAPDGALLWEANEPLNFDALAFGAFIAITNTAETESLYLPLYLAIPTTVGDRYHNAPGLLLSMGLSAPRWLLEPARAGAVQRTYRVWVSGDPPLYLPLKSFSARWTEDGLALSVVCPGLTLAQVETLAARVGEPLVLDSAYRLGGDPVSSQWIEFLRVNFQLIRGSFGSNSASSILEGNAQTTVDGGQTRTAQGISYRTGGAQRRVRCAPDTYLRPGDILQDGAETWTVGDITLSVSATNATMEVLERGA